MDAWAWDAFSECLSSYQRARSTAQASVSSLCLSVRPLVRFSMSLVICPSACLFICLLVCTSFCMQIKTDRRSGHQISVPYRWWLRGTMLWLGFWVEKVRGQRSYGKKVGVAPSTFLFLHLQSWTRTIYRSTPASEMTLNNRFGIMLRHRS